MPYLNLEARNNRMVELNVQEQVNNLAKTAIIQSAWKHHKRPDIHGWAYGLKMALPNTICTIPAGTR
jgi:carbonic anhydrase